MANFVYDVAFSLLAADEPIARGISTFLRCSRFLFTERQLELAGADGVERFSRAFRRDSRLVALLYRQGWGTTQWTQIESEAIRSRVLVETADFLTVLALDNSPVPDWVPASRLWARYADLGAQGAAAVLEQRVVDRGAVNRPLTAREQARVLQEQQQESARREAFLTSELGVSTASVSARAVLQGLRDLGPDLSAAVNTEGNGVVMLYRDHVSVVASWYPRFANTLAGAEFVVAEWNGRPNVGGRYTGERRGFRRHIFVFDTPTTGDHCWRNKATGEYHGALDLADWIGRLLLARVGQDRNGLDR